MIYSPQCAAFTFRSTPLGVSDRELAEGYNRVASLDGKIKLSENWISQLQLVASDTDPYAGEGESHTGVQRNFQINHVGRNWNTHTLFIWESVRRTL